MPVAAAAADSLPKAAAEGSDRWLVELPSAPTADGTSLTTTRSEKAAFRSEAKQAGLKYSERFAFDTLWNGLSIELSESRVAALSRLASVKAVYPVVRASIAPTDPVADPALYTATAMTGADIAQNELGLSGAGVRVAVMDSGIDYDHPDLGGCFGPGCRVATGYDFVGDEYRGSAGSAPVPDADPDDCGGHGTHVAGIVGAKGEVTGVAPGVTFGAYRVFGCEGSTSSDIMIAAMERALADKMQVLNMSIVSAFQWPQYPTATAASRLVNKGVVVIASIGNDGAYGLYSAGAPGVGDKVIGVASFTNSHQPWPSFTITDDGRRIAYAALGPAPASPTEGSGDIVATGTSTSTADACSPLAEQSLAGKVALIRRGGCAFHTKANYAQQAGAAAVLIYNNVPGAQLVPGAVFGEPSITIPAAFISGDDGVLIDGRLAGAPVTLTWTAEVARAPSWESNLISQYSSYGLSPDLALKPDLGAPGGLIHSTLPLEQGRHGTLSGTSMASPHVAGAAALLLQAKPRTSAASLRTIFQNSADPKPSLFDPGNLDNVHRQGAGMLDIPAAILATTKIEPAKLSLGESQGGPATRTLTITNQSETTKTYELSPSPALATGPDTFMAVPWFNAPATVSFSSAGRPVTSVTVPGGQTATVDVTIAAPSSLADRSIYGGYAVLTNSADPDDVLRIPYAGFKGDYQSIQALTPTSNDFPWLARSGGSSYSKATPASATYSMADSSNIPYVVLHLHHQVRRLRAEVLDASTGASWHRAFDHEYLARHAMNSDFSAFAWDGVTTSGKKTYTVPDGRYVLKLTAVKALGTEPADVESWTSPAFTIDRP